MIVKTKKKPQTYAEAVREISAGYDSLSRRLKQIAQFALDNPNDFAIQTIAEISKRADVQPSSLIRFAKAFGFDGFSDIQRLFQQRLLESRPSYADRLAAMRDDLEGGERNAPALLRQFTDANVAALHHLSDEIPEKDLERATALMKGAATIYVLAQRRAYPVASSFFYMVSKIGRPAVLLDNVGGMVFEQRLQMKDSDLLFATSFADYTPVVIDAVSDAAERGIPVVSITDHPLSPLAQHSSVCFFVEDATMHGFRALAASICLAQVLAISLGVSDDSQ